MTVPTVVTLTTPDDVSVVSKLFPAPETGIASATRRNLSYVIGHGFTGSADRPDVERIARFLAESGATVLVPSFRGHGASGGLSTVGADEVHDMAACVDWLRAERPGDAVVTLGFSMGASVVVRHAGLGGAPDAVVAVSGPGRWYERGTRNMRMVHFGVETRLGRFVLRHGWKTRVGRNGWTALPEAPVEVAGHIEVPLLVVHGDADAFFGLEHARMLAAAAPRSELWIESGMGHAETAVTPELLTRIDRWCRAATGTSANMNP